MIKAIAWAMRQHPDKLTSTEKLVLIGLADMCNGDFLVYANQYKLSRFACIDLDLTKDIIANLASKGFITALDEERGTVEQHDVYKLIVTN